jgi:transcriptional regulator of arginine metabolism
MQKDNRHRTILNLIGAKRIGRQDEIVKALADLGFTVTQASVSRVLDELGIVKLNGAYTQPQHGAAGLGIVLLSVDAAGPNLLVAKTPAGLASASAVMIDAAKLPQIVGTLAGDDTIFIAVTGEKEQKAVIKTLWEMFAA